MNKFNLTEHIIKECATYHKVAFSWRREEISYSQLFTLTEKMASWFESWGVKRGERVLLLMNDTPGAIVSFLGAIWIGAVPILLSPRLKMEQFIYVLTDCNAVVVICELNVAKDIQLAVQKTKVSPRIVVQDMYPLQDVYEFSKLSEILTPLPHSPPFAQLSEDEGAYWQYTSGTTGNPKGVVHNSKGMIENTQLFANDILDITSSDRIYSTAKLFFGYGLGNSLFFNLLSGATALLDDRWPTSEIVLENIQSFAPSVFFSSPTLYNDLFAQGNKLKKYMANNSRYCSAGSHLPGSLFNKWKSKFDIEILNGIGATEVGHIYICNRQGHACADITGKEVQGYKVNLLDKDGSPVPRGVNGMLWVKRPSVSLGYHNRLNESDDRFKDGWYCTGDIFTRDLDGNYKYIGREDELFKCKGRWVVPVDIENYILENFTEVAEALVMPMIDEDELIVTAICLEMRSPILEQKLIRNIENNINHSLTLRFASYMYPKHYYFMSNFPKNDNGKINRSELITTVYREVGSAL